MRYYKQPKLVMLEGDNNINVYEFMKFVERHPELMQGWVSGIATGLGKIGQAIKQRIQEKKASRRAKQRVMYPHLFRSVRQPTIPEPIQSRIPVNKKEFDNNYIIYGAAITAALLLFY